MLKVQDFLRSGKSLEDLTTELGIKVLKHDSLPLMILNYNQIDSPKTHPIVRECRGLVLDTSYNLVARAFPRFYNWGEVQEEMDLFDFSDFVVHTKEDGSLCILHYFQGSWRANTRGSFAQDLLQFTNLTWTDAFCQAMHIASLSDLSGKLDPNLTYVCEFCSGYNKIVRRYPTPVMFLLAAYDGEQELHYKTVDSLTDKFFLRPSRFEFKSVQEVQDFLTEQASADPTYEGVVICDKNGLRYKIKSPTYLGLHRLRGEGNNLFNPKHLLPFVLAGEADELLLYFPEATASYNDCKAKVQAEYEKLEQIWLQTWQIESQKDFALTIVGKTKFTGLLFSLRKLHGKDQTVDKLKKLWRDSSDTLLKFVFGK